MKRIIALLITLLFISITANAATDCNMPEQTSNCSDMLHMVPVTHHDSDDCCSISAADFEKEISFQKQNGFNPFIIKESLEYNHTTQFQSFTSVNYKLSYVYPPPLKTIKLLC